MRGVHVHCVFKIVRNGICDVLRLPALFEVTLSFPGHIPKHPSALQKYAVLNRAGHFVSFGGKAVSCDEVYPITTSPIPWLCRRLPSPD